MLILWSYFWRNVLATFTGTYSVSCVRACVFLHIVQEKKKKLYIVKKNLSSFGKLNFSHSFVEFAIEL